ncbi:hypothetical protein [Ligilactobacillus ceti]|uniref:hypothetical protein n=1 Tax=Ligilactobacillus ceti TaxID=395085 RepID=UPI00041614F1|nr:hypothetical protein [Ligilactobacillus ceti]
MSITSVVMIVVLAVLVIYNLRLSFTIARLKSKVQFKQPQDLTEVETEKLQKIAKARRKWVVLSQLFFWFSIYLAVMGSTGQLLFFMILYVVVLIVLNKYAMLSTQAIIEN